jgi:hypothetical protein
MNDSAVVGEREVVAVDLESAVGDDGAAKVKGGGRLLAATLIALVSMVAVTYFLDVAESVVPSTIAADLG